MLPEQWIQAVVAVDPLEMLSSSVEELREVAGRRHRREGEGRVLHGSTSRGTRAAVCSPCHGGVLAADQQIPLKVPALLGLPPSPWAGHSQQDLARYLGTWFRFRQWPHSRSWKALLGSALVMLLHRLELAAELLCPA